MAQKDLAILLSIMSLVTGGFWLWCMKNGDTREMSAMLCFVGIVAAALAHWVKRAPADPVAALCGASVLCYGIQAFFGISSFLSAPFFWLSVAILCAAQNE